MEVYCDASMTGWGCWTSDGREAFGVWSSYERTLHINFLECMSVKFAFQCFFKSTYDTCILIHSDSTTVVAYVNHQGGTVSARVCDLVLEIWGFCLDRDILISAVHLPGIKNTKADALSRLEDADHSYSISQDFFDLISDNLSFSLKIDCFASRLNYKLNTFMSRYYDPLSSWVNAFSVKWTDNLYIFPPLPVIHRVIGKFIVDRPGHGLLICPYWPSQPWFPSLLGLLIAPPFLIPSDSILDEKNRLPRSCRLVGWSIGSSHAKHMAYLRGLRNVASGRFPGRPSLHIRNVGPGSVVGIINGKQITVESL